MNQPRIVVIGAGCSGITSIKNLLQAGLTNIICFDQNDRVGGNWIYSEEPSHSSVCETTHIISSKSLSQFLDFPMPESYPDYPSHDQVRAYFQSYAEHFGLLPYIRFNTPVQNIEPIPADRWRIHLADHNTEEADYLLVANGHHHVPRHPEWKDDFTGTYLHAHSYKNNKPFRDQRVLVVGAGNSGCDCAVEISRVAAFVGISIRTPQYIVPKFFLGKPTDAFNRGLQWVPEFLIRPLRKLSLRFQIGRYEDYGLESPKHDVIEAHPTVNSELLYKIRHGKVHPRRGIARIDGQTVHFMDGRKEAYDTIIAATGYQIATPFFDPGFLDYREADRIPLYLRMFHPVHPSLIFIGLVQPQGAIWPLSDRQAKLAANYIAGRWKRPADLTERAEREADRIARDFLAQKRHVVEVHFDRFARQVEQEIPKSAPEWNPTVITTSGQHA